LINQVSLSFPATKRSLKRASAIFVSNRTTLNFLPSAVHDKCVIVPPNALRPEDENPAPRQPKVKVGTTLRLLYVGNCVATRAVPIVFDALIESGLKDYKFAIVGKGPAIPGWKEKSAELGLADKVDFVGQIPQADLAKYYEEADALVFPALRDSGGSALLEAMSRNLPVTCLDWAGPGEMVGPGSGLKIPVDKPERTVTEFAAALKRIHNDPALGISLAREAQKRSQALFRWEEKFRVLQSTYSRLIKKG
jgi:glycosyltransferase involved in cell wall biosynthesis